MKIRNENLNIIGLFLILLVITIFSYYNNIDNTDNNINIKKKSISYNIIKNNLNNFKRYNTILENNVLKLKISTLGGNIESIYLKKYGDNKSHVKLSKDFGFIHNIIFVDVNNKNNYFQTANLNFHPFLYKNTLVLKALNPIGKGELYYIYKINGKNLYDIDFSIKNNIDSSYILRNITFNNRLISLEKDRNWENSYTRLCYLSNNNVKYLSEKQDDEKVVDYPVWIANKQQFFTSIIIPKQMSNSIFLKSYNTDSKGFLKTFYINIPFYKKYNSSVSFKLYFGPLDFNILKKYDKKFENIIPFGWGFLKWINVFFFLPIFNMLEKTNLNYGVIVILMTIVVKFILYPITYKQYKLSISMQSIQDELNEIGEKYSKNGDMLRKQQSIMKLYKKKGINPLSGCFSAVLQIPIFYSLFKFFPTLINLRNKSFLWVDDLTSYDSILKFSFYIPFYGDHISLLTVLYSIALLLYTKISSNNISNNISSSDNMNIMLYLMPCFMLIFINNYSSALSLYYFTSNVINIIFFFLIRKILLGR